ncbi:MAG TPA: helix-turn-helix transcriptional regulator [Gaiellaceae bacterium]
MRSVSERDAAALLEVAVELASLDDARAFPAQFLARLGRLIGTDRSTFCELDRRNRRVVLEANWEDGVETLIVDEVGDEYAWELLKEHPVCSRRVASGDWTTPHAISDYMPLRELRRTALWNEMYRDENVNYWLDMGLPMHHGHSRVFIFLGDTHDFGSREKLILELLEPHLERRARDADLAAAAVEALADVNEGGEAHDVVLATARGTIEFASPHARALLRTYFGVADGTLPVQLRRGTTVVTLPGGRLTVRTARVGDLLVLLLGEEDARVDELTARQREILALVARGLTDAQIAERLEIAAATVNKHLEAVYKRLDVHTRTAAAAYLHRPGRGETVGAGRYGLSTGVGE